MNPEVRVLLDRANARRISLLGLVDVIPDQYWARRETADSWTAREHLAHVATADELLRETVGRTLEGSYEARRAELLAQASVRSIRELLEEMERERAILTTWLDRLPGESLDDAVTIAGTVDTWGRELSASRRGLLAAWSEHDSGHEAAIRRAVTTPPDAAALSVAARRRH